MAILKFAKEGHRFTSSSSIIIRKETIRCRKRLGGGRLKIPPSEFLDSTPVRSPNLNAFAERLVWSIKESCLDRMVLIGEPTPHRATTQFVVHYHQERNHQGLNNKLIRPEFNPLPSTGLIRCRKRLGGMFN